MSKMKSRFQIATGAGSLGWPMAVDDPMILPPADGF